MPTENNIDLEIMNNTPVFNKKKHQDDFLENTSEKSQRNEH